jgi:hypothetical protein
MTNPDKCVVITGGSKGLGYEFAKLYAREQFNLILVARDQTELTKVAEKLEKDHGITCHTFSYDLSDMGEIDKFHQATKEKNLGSLPFRVGKHC